MDYNVLNEIKENSSFNKSSLFLLPMLGLQKEIKPLNTYLGFEEIEMENSLILLFSRHQKNYELWENDLTTHRLFDFIIEEDEYVYHAYNLYPIEDDYKAICNGEYSKISVGLKTILNIIGNPLVHIAINPELFYSKLAYELNTSVEDIINNVEIVTKPSKKNEYIHVSKELKELVKTYI